MKSKKYQLTREDLVKWLNNIALYGATALVVFLTSIQAGNSIDSSLLALYTRGISSIIDLLKKYLSNNTVKDLKLETK